MANRSTPRTPRAAGRSSAKIEVTNPFTGKTEKVSAKQYAKYGDKYFYNREYDRLRKAGVTGKAREQALQLTKEILRGERPRTGERPSTAFIRTRKATNAHAEGLEFSTSRRTKFGAIDNRSGLTMLQRGVRQTAWEVMQEMERYGLKGELARLHTGAYTYSEVDDSLIFLDEIDTVRQAGESGLMPEAVAQQLIDTLTELL